MEAVLHAEAGAVRAVVAGPGGGGGGGVGGGGAGAGEGRGGAAGPQPLGHLHRLKHAPRVVPGGQGGQLRPRYPRGHPERMSAVHPGA